MRKMKQNWCLANFAWHYLCQEGSKTWIFVHTICFGQSFGAKTVKTRKHYTNCGFSENCPKPKMTPFFEKWFLGWVKKVVSTNCVFEKLCSSEKAVAIKKMHVERNRKFMINCGLVEHGKMVFSVFFQVLMFLCFFSFFECFLFLEGLFFCFLFVSFCFFFLEGLRVRWGDPKGQSLGPKPSFLCFLLFDLVFIFSFGV